MPLIIPQGHLVIAVEGYPGVFGGSQEVEGERVVH